jgi:hypothetical protein
MSIGNLIERNAAPKMRHLNLAGYDYQRWIGIATSARCATISRALNHVQLDAPEIAGIFSW